MRSVLSVRGLGAAKVINSITTNDVARWWSSGGSQPLALAFLTTKGRVLAEALAWRSDCEPDAVLLDCATSELDAVARQLKLYKLRAKVSIEPRPEFAVATAHDLSVFEAALASGVDPRAPALGARALVHASDLARFAHDACAYTSRRLALGVGEGDEIAGRIPLMCNLDALNAVSFDKGCYLGQEQTARAHHRGTVRRRLVPIALAASHASAADRAAAFAAAPDCAADTESYGEVQPKAELVDPVTGKSVGEVVSVAPDAAVAIAMLQMDFVVGGGPLALDVGGGVASATAYVPAWWPETLRRPPSAADS